MSQGIFEMMMLQGKIRIEFMLAGIDEEKAHDLAAEALHLFLVSDMAKSEYKEAYEALPKEESPAGGRK